MIRGIRTGLVAALLIGAAHSAHAATVAVTAISATDERPEKRYDAASQEHRKLLDGLSFTSYRKTGGKDVAVSAGQEYTVPLNDRYTLFMRAQPPAPDGRLAVNVRIHGISRQGGKPVKVLETRLLLARDKPVLIRGLRIEGGELLLILNLD